MSPDYDSFARHMHAKGGAGSTLFLEQCPASSLKDRENGVLPALSGPSPRERSAELHAQSSTPECFRHVDTAAQGKQLALVSWWVRSGNERVHTHVYAHRQEHAGALVPRAGRLSGSTC